MRYSPHRLAVVFLVCAIELQWRFTIICGLCHDSHVVSPIRRDASTALSKSRRNAQHDPTNDSSPMDHSCPTTAILRISYDGTRFTGWSASNDPNRDTGRSSQKDLQQATRRSRRRKSLMLGTVETERILPKGFVRSVEGVLRTSLAKIYGNVDPRTIVVEGCSRTDRGVHATGMVAQIYCFKPKVLDTIQNHHGNTTSTTLVGDEGGEYSMAFSIPGRRLPHPAFPTDESCFERLPMHGNLGRLAFALNRMGPSDVQVTGIAPVPQIHPTSNETSTSTTPATTTTPLPFHPTLSSMAKRYEYKISVGAFPDPTSRTNTWHVGDHLDTGKMEQACQILVGSHNFRAFQGVPRGPEERRKYRFDSITPNNATRCSLRRLEIATVPAPAPSNVYFPNVTPPLCSYKIIVEGDRFLYKMVRFLVGALVAVGRDKLELHDLQWALQMGNWNVSAGQERDGRKEFECAPPHGLVLSDVDYGPWQIQWQSVRYEQ